jgi:uncharacterized protein
MALDWIIVDGYNLIHQDESLKDLLERDIGLARQRLTRLLERAIPRLAARVTVVFDGRGALGGRSDFESGTVEVLFSSANSSADTLIESMVAAAARPEGILVVTSDLLEANAAAASGAETASCAAFLARLAGELSTLRARPNRAGLALRLGRIGEHFPEDA